MRPPHHPLGRGIRFHRSLSGHHPGKHHPDLFPFITTVTTMNTTPSLPVSLSGSIADFTGTESITCDQILLTFQ